ncbi:MAG TPA: asparagine synthase [Gammaproteobacteria bacterium]|nr:asparagine synthase [Gammaproteobacteria bacterium]
MNSLALLLDQNTERHRRTRQILFGIAPEDQLPRNGLTLTPGSGCAIAARWQAAISGDPRWRDEDLARIAREEGHARALIEAWHRDGARSLEGLEGHWALAVHEVGTQRTHLAVDALGIATLAWSVDADRILAHTRADQVARALGTGIDPQGLYDYLYCHMVPAPATVWQRVQKLRPGHLVSIGKDGVRIERWWSPHWREPERANLEELANNLRSSLETATERALGEGPAAAFLSGGLDSSSVVSMAARLRGTAVDAFSIGFAVPGYDEMEWARAAARHAGVRLHERYVTPEDVLAAIPEVSAAYDEPFGNASAVPALICARTARAAGFNRILAGDGGDEIFGGNARYAKQFVFEHWQRLPVSLRALLAPVLDNPLTRRMPVLTKAASYVSQAEVPLPDRLESYNFLHRHDPAEVFTSGFLAQVDREHPLDGMRSRWTTTDGVPVIKRMLDLDLEYTLADNDLRKVNRTCALAGIEVRYPFLDAGMMRLATGLPAAWLVRNGELRWFYRRAMQGVLAKATLAKGKHGFGLPFGLWLREHAGLRTLASEHLQALRRRAWFREDWIDFLLRQHQQGHAEYYGVMIWVMVLLEAWMQAQEAAGTTR